MQARWTLQDAKNRFSDAAKAACSGVPQIVTKRGQKAVAIISTDSYSQFLQQGMASPATFKDLLVAMPPGKWPRSGISSPRFEVPRD